MHADMMESWQQHWETCRDSPEKTKTNRNTMLPSSFTDEDYDGYCTRHQITSGNTAVSSIAASMIVLPDPTDLTESVMSSSAPVSPSPSRRNPDSEAETWRVTVKHCHGSSWCHPFLI